VTSFLKNFKTKYSKQIMYVRCENSGENKVLEIDCKREGLGIVFKFTAPNTPQHSEVVERAFEVLYWSIKTMVKTASLEDSLI
jgi:hypothetical protein